jgi:hypothetical protein
LFAVATASPLPIIVNRSGGTARRMGKALGDRPRHLLARDELQLDGLPGHSESCLQAVAQSLAHSPCRAA